MAALCATIGEAKRGKVTGSCTNAEKLMVQCFPCIALLDKHARTYCWSDQKLLALMTLRKFLYTLDSGSGSVSVYSIDSLDPLGEIHGNPLL